VKDIQKEVWNKLTESERREISRLLKMPTLPDVLRPAFPLQRQFIDNSSKLKALFCTRRSAKSYTAGLYLIKTCLERPNTSSVYIGLTRDQAKRIVWTDVFKNIINTNKIKCKFNETELTVTFPNGSILYVLGVDDSDSEKDKLLGKKYALAVIDEAASYSIDLEDLIYKILKPAMADLRGTIVLCGTPDNRKDGIFYRLTRDLPVSPPQRTAREGWEIFTWSTYDNPYMAEQWRETISELTASDPHVHEQAWFRQHYLGQWTIEDNNKIYRYNTDRNGWDGVLPDYGWKPWQYVLGIDLGFNDATALVLLAYHENDGHVYIIKADKWRGLTITDVADKIRLWMSDYPVGYFVVDGANKQAVEEMVRHHQLPLQAAEKSDKVSFIRIMNSDFVSGKIKMYEPSCAPLVEEYDKAIWQKRALEKGIYREDPSFHPDAADAALYAYRYCYHYANTPPSPEQFMKSDYERECLELQKRFAAQRDIANDGYILEGSEHLFDL